MLPAIRRARGRIVFVSSIGGRIAFPLTGAYHAAKFGIEAVGDVFRQELRPWGIAVSIVEPGSIDTPIWKRANDGADAVGDRAPPTRRLSTAGRSPAIARSSSSWRSAGSRRSKVAVAIEHALTASRPRSRYLVGLDVKLQTRAKAVDPDACLRSDRRPDDRPLSSAARNPARPILGAAD